MANNQQTNYFMSGGGVTGELLRSSNWHDSPLGDPAFWPQNLKTAISIVIGSQYPMFIWWGPFRINLVNDAYIPVMGNKFPAFFGKPASEAWAEIWDEVLKPLADIVFEKGEAVYGDADRFFLERKGFPEELFFSFSYSPIFNEDGSVGGLFCACHDDTVKVLNSRRLHNLSNLKSAISAASTQEAACDTAINVLQRNNHDIPFAVLYRLDAKTNTASQIRAFGVPPDEQVFPISLAINDSPGGPFWESVLEHPFEWRKMLYGVNSHINEVVGFISKQTPDKALKFTITPGADSRYSWMFILGISPHRNFDEDYDQYLRQIQADIEQAVSNISQLEAGVSRVEELVELDKQKTAQFLHINEERSIAERNMYNLLMHAPVAIAIYRGEDFVIELANERMLLLWDSTSPEVLNKPLFEVKPELQEQGFDKLMLRAMHSGEAVVVSEMQVELIIKGQAQIAYVKLVCEPLKDDQGQVTGVMVLGHDISDQVKARKQVEASEMRFRNAIKRTPIPIAMMRGSDLVMEITNDAYLALVDRKLEDLEGKPLTSSMPELISQGIIDILQKVYTTGEEFTATDFPVSLMYNGLLEQRYFSFVYTRLQDTYSNDISIMSVAWDVTELVRARFALEESQRQFSITFMQSPMGIAILRGEDLVVERANKTILQTVWLKSEEEIVGKRVLDVFPEMIDQKFPALLLEVLRTGKEYRDFESETHFRTANGVRNQYFDLQYAPLYDREQQISGVMITAYDVTERVLDRKRLQEAEERSRLAIEATGLGSFDWDLNTSVFTFSQRLADIFGGGDKNDFNHQDLINRIHPDDRPIRDTAVANCFELGWLNYQVRLIWPDGSLHWVSIYGKIVYNNDGAPVKMHGTALDISKERNYRDALQQSETKFRSLANFMPQFIWTTDSEGTLTYFNQAILGYSGLTAYEMQSGGWIQLVHPGERMAVYHRLMQAFQTGEEFFAEARLRNKDGDYRWQFARSVAFRDENDNIQMWIGTSIDIHDRKMMAEELEQRVEQRTAELKLANEELLRTNQELEQFAYVSSHDLQEPLRKIQTFSDLVNSRLEDANDEVRSFLNKINASARRMSVLINDLLNYSRVSKADENFVAVNLNRVLHNVSNDFEVLIKQKNAIVRADTLPIIRGIPIQINQLFYNLLSNALKFCSEKPVIKITCEELAGDELPPNIPLPQDKIYVVLHFADNGIGFEQVYASQIFTIFQRLNNRSQYSGTGIGLAICKKIAENHEGFITAESEPGQGSTFHVYLAK